MNYRDARPGKPGQWNGRPQRWRSYLRGMKRHNRKAVERIAAEEIAMKRRLARNAMLVRWVSRLLFVGLVAWGVVSRCVP